MVKIIFIKDWRDFKKGKIISTSDSAAKNYIEQGFAEYYEKISKKEPQKDINKKTENDVRVVRVVLDDSKTLINSDNTTHTSTHTHPTHTTHTSNTINTSNTTHTQNKLYDIDVLLEIIKEIKYKILILCIEKEKTLKELSETLNLTETAIKHHISRSTNNKITGLMSENLIEFYDKKDKANSYKTNINGINKILNLQLEYEKKQEQIRFEEEVQQQKEFEIQQQQEFNDNIIKVIKDFIDLYYSHKFNQKELIRIDFKILSKHSVLLANELLDNYEKTIDLFVIAFKDINKKFDNVFSFYNIPKSEMVSISALDYNNFDKLVVVEGIIKSRSERKPKITLQKYECPNCGKFFLFQQKSKFLEDPHMMCTCGRKGKFTLLENTMKTVQRLELEEFSENLEGVNEPRCVNIMLTNDLCKPEYQKHYNPGTRIKFWGVLKPEQTYSNTKKKTLIDYYIETNGFEVLEQSLEFNVSNKEQEKILKLSKRKDIINLLVNSFSPEIFGCKPCKFGLLISAVKGYLKLPKYKRDRIHVLLVGNPGSGKTVMIKKIIELTKLSRFASGLNSSKVGLTAAVVQDKFLGGYKLNAGAVPLANNGVCGVDEFDKINEDDKKSMNGAMEEGEIVIDKASIHQKLKANTTIVATCNPKNEIFDEQQPYYLQYNLPKSLIDRFDLIFVINSDAFEDPFMDLIKDNDNEIIDEDLLSKYIIMAQNTNPVLSKEIELYLVERSSEFKKTWKSLNFRYGFRQFHSVRNITYAIGRLKLLKNITKDEVDEAFKLYNNSIESQQYDVLM